MKMNSKNIGIANELRLPALSPLTSMSSSD
jgi:hypothetical protein